MSEPHIRLALLGAGIFVKDAYIPLLRRSTERVSLVAIWSRSESAAADLLPIVKDFAPDATALSGEGGLKAVIEDPGVDAVAIVLPAHVQLELAERALAAGKAVLQEKPIALTAADAFAAVARHRAHACTAVWAVAENYRSEKVFREAAALVPDLGRLVKLDLVCDMPMNVANKYFNSAWRRDDAHCPGGFMMESSVHFLAALRMLAAAGGAGEARQAWAHSSHANAELPSPDTLVGGLVFDADVAASVSISFAAAQVRFSLSVVGTDGSLEVAAKLFPVQRGGWGAGRGEYKLLHRQADGEPAEARMAFTGLDDELAAFVEQAHGAQVGSPLSLSSPVAASTSPEAAAADLAAIEALLASAKSQGSLVNVLQGVAIADA